VSINKNKVMMGGYRRIIGRVVIEHGEEGTRWLRAVRGKGVGCHSIQRRLLCT